MAVAWVDAQAVDMRVIRGIISIVGIGIVVVFHRLFQQGRMIAAAPLKDDLVILNFLNQRRLDPDIPPFTGHPYILIHRTGDQIMIFSQHQKFMIFTHSA